MIVYADTSFLVSLYIRDTNSAAATALAGRLQLGFFLTPLVELELTNAFELRRFRKEITAAELGAARGDFRRDLEAGVYLACPMPQASFEHAKEMASRRTARLGVRSLDLLHVACALALHAERFLSFDGRQKKLAAAEGLEVLTTTLPA